MSTGMSTGNPVALASKLFEATFQSAPSAIYSAPGRVNLIGEHTDYNLGKSLPIAISQRTYVAIRQTPGSMIRVVSDISETPVVWDGTNGRLPVELGWALYPIGVWWSLAKNSNIGFDMAFVSEVPLGSGLSSSAAIECATAIAIDDQLQLGHTRLQLAQACQLAENQVVGAPTGLMDQMASLMSKRATASLIDFKTLTVENVDFNIETAGLELLVIDTGVKHSNASGGYGQRRQQCESAARKLAVGSLGDIDISMLDANKTSLSDIEYRRAKHIVTDNHRVTETAEALARGDYQKLAQIFLASHESLRDDFEVSCDELNLIVDTCYQSGALASRMTGGGFGGAAIAVVETGLIPEISEALTAAFASAGFKAPLILRTTASIGATKE